MLKTILTLAILAITPTLSALTLKTEFCDTNRCQVYTEGVFAIWWDKKYNHSNDAPKVTAHMNKVRKIVMSQYHMQDPPNIGRGNYVNIYIFHPKEDVFPHGWGNGVGTDKYKNPFYTLPYNVLPYTNILSHECFHLYQYSGKIPYGGDTGWFIEASANWFAATLHPKRHDLWAGAYSFVNHPQLQFWHSEFFNAEVKNWGRGMHQYVMSLFLYYLTEEKGVPRKTIAHSFYAGIKTSPQHYLYEQVGPEKFRKYWLDFATDITRDLSFLSDEQKRFAKGEYEREMRGKNDNQQYVAVLDSDGTNGQWQRPDREHVARSWGYNVIKINNRGNRQYTVRLEGDQQSDKGTPSHLVARVVKSNGQKVDFDLAENRRGKVTIHASPRDRTLYLVIAATPEKFKGSDRFYYRYSISSTGSNQTSSRWQPCQKGRTCLVPGRASEQYMFRQSRVQNQKTYQLVRMVKGGQRVTCKASFQCSTAMVEWTKCADEGGQCKITAVEGSRVIFKYGAGSDKKSWAFSKAQGQQTIPCNNGRWGDPAPNVRKGCYFTELEKSTWPGNLKYKP